MIYDGVEYHPVTDNLGLLAARKRKEGELSSQELGEYAFSLGLHPPAWAEDDIVPAIVVVHPPDRDEAVPVWDTMEDEEQDDRDTSDHDNPWGEIVAVDGPEDSRRHEGL